MADHKRSTQNEGARRRRPAPTIDLAATELKPEPPAAEPPKPEPQPEDATAQPPSGSPSARASYLRYAGFGASLAAGVVATLAVLWFASHLPTGGSSAGAIRDRIAALEAQVNAASNAPPAADNAALRELNQRLGKLEQTVSQAPARPAADPALGERLTALENSIKALGDAVSTLGRRADDTAATLSAIRDQAGAAAKAAQTLQARVDAIEQSAKATQDKVAQNSGADAAARRALAAYALREAALRGAPFSAELAAMKNLGADAKALAALEPFAETGVPTDAALARQISALLPALSAASGADAAQAGGFFERLQANAGKLVRVHPIGEPAGDDPSAVMARLEVKAAHNDIAGIASELAKLPAKARAVANPWSQKLAARDAALAAARNLAAESAAALGAR